tara:strand:+ start:1050 stop:1460 length:411 start_codon:yes stop_codon:yes gene_type:complete
MDIKETSIGIMRKAIQNFAKEHNVDNTKSAVLISTKDEANSTPIYTLLINNIPKGEVSFNQILNVKIDFLGREIIASPFIANTIRRLARENKCSVLDVNVLVYTQDENADKVLLYFFIGRTPKKHITFEYLFAEMD